MEVDRDVLLALVEAVEAAKVEADNRKRSGQGITGRLSDALGRFDFGDGRSTS